jgi:hypothetical protein
VGSLNFSILLPKTSIAIKSTPNGFALRSVFFALPASESFPEALHFLV